MLLFSIEMVILVFILLLYVAMITEGIKLVKRKKNEKKQKYNIINNACKFYEFLLSKDIDSLDYSLLCAIACECGYSYELGERELDKKELKKKLTERLDYYINLSGKFDTKMLLKKIYTMNIPLEKKGYTDEDIVSLSYEYVNEIVINDSKEKPKIYVKKNN